MFPTVRVDPTVLYIDDGNVLTSAGVAAGLDLCLHVVRKDHGAAVASEIAHHTVVAPHREGGQAQFIRDPVLEPEAESSMSQAMAWSLEHLDQPISLSRLAGATRTSVRRLSRRFRLATGMTPLQWLRT